MEIWKDIPGYKGYQASSIGRIRTHNKITYTEHHGERHWKDRILKPKKDKENNLRVSLWKNNKERTILVHRLIGSTFLENNLDTKLTINHKDGNRLNNNVENLEWITRKENIQYGYEHGQYDSMCKKCKLKINDKIINFASLSKASKYLGKNVGYISYKIKKGKYIINDIKYGTVYIYA